MRPAPGRVGGSSDCLRAKPRFRKVGQLDSLSRVRRFVHLCGLAAVNVDGSGPGTGQPAWRDIWRCCQRYSLSLPRAHRSHDLGARSSAIRAVKDPPQARIRSELPLPPGHKTKRTAPETGTVLIRADTEERFALALTWCACAAGRGPSSWPVPNAQRRSSGRPSDSLPAGPTSRGTLPGSCRSACAGDASAT